MGEIGRCGGKVRFGHKSGRNFKCEEEEDEEEQEQSSIYIYIYMYAYVYVYIYLHGNRAYMKIYRERCVCVHEEVCV